MKYNSVYTFIILLTISIAFLGACSNSAEQETESSHSHAADEVHDHDHEEGEVSLTALQIEKIGLELGSFEMKNLSSTIKANGILEIPPQNRATVGALMEGSVHRIFAKPGQYVKKGQRLALLRNLELINMQQELLESESELSYLTKEFERQKNLVEKEIAAKKQFEKVQSDLIAAKARNQALRSKLNLLGISTSRSEDNFVSGFPIISPISGFVKDIHINTGMFVATNTPLFDLVDNHHIHIDLSVFEKDLPYLSIGQEIDFALQSKPGEVMKARIFAIGKALNRQEGTIAVHAEIENKSGLLLPGMYVEARIITQNRLVRSLPEAAVTTDKGLSYIFIKEEDEAHAQAHEQGIDHSHEDAIHFKKVQVLTANRDIGYVEVTPLEGIGQQAEIVAKGAYFLMAESKKGEMQEGHSH